MRTEIEIKTEDSRESKNLVHGILYTCILQNRPYIYYRDDTLVDTNDVSDIHVRPANTVTINVLTH